MINFIECSRVCVLTYSLCTRGIIKFCCVSYFRFKYMIFWIYCIISCCRFVICCSICTTNTFNDSCFLVTYNCILNFKVSCKTICIWFSSSAWINRSIISRKFWITFSTIGVMKTFVWVTKIFWNAYNEPSMIGSCNISGSRKKPTTQVPSTKNPERMTHSIH